MKIYTSYFAKLRKLPVDIVPISICGKAPEGYTGVQYKVLAPKHGFFMEWKRSKDNNYYIECFNLEVLDLLNAQDIFNKLEELSGGKDCVLVCYEKSGDFCHRHLVSKWLSDKLNISVVEWA